MKHLVDVRAISTPQASAFDEFDQAELLKEVEVPLYGPYGPAQGLCQGLHLGPAQAGLVVSVVCKGAVGGYCLCRDPGLHEVAHLGYARKLWLRWHDRLLFVVRRCALVDLDGKIHQSGGLRLKNAPPLFLCSCQGSSLAYLKI
jgi:hypothetical protein